MWNIPFRLFLVISASGNSWAKNNMAATSALKESSPRFLSRGRLRLVWATGHLRSWGNGKYQAHALSSLRPSKEAQPETQDPCSPTGQVPALGKPPIRHLEHVWVMPLMSNVQIRLLRNAEPTQAMNPWVLPQYPNGQSCSVTFS